jgi:hypothetical protein
VTNPHLSIHRAPSTICYSIVGEIPSRQLLVKTIALGRNAYNVVGIICSILTPYMVNPTAWNWQQLTAFFWAGICFCCIIYTYFRIPETTGRSFAELGEWACLIAHSSKADPIPSLQTSCSNTKSRPGVSRRPTSTCSPRKKERRLLERSRWAKTRICQSTSRRLEGCVERLLASRSRLSRLWLLCNYLRGVIFCVEENRSCTRQQNANRNQGVSRLGLDCFTIFRLIHERQERPESKNRCRYTATAV